MERPREFVLLSVRATADRLGTDPATMVRIVRGMQFNSYREFQHYLQDLSIASATSLDMMQQGRKGKLALPKYVGISLEQDVKNLQRLVRGVEPARVAALARRMHAARRILLLGGDLASCLVAFFEYQLTILGLPVSSATSPGAVVHKVRHMEKRDLVIAVTFGRGLRQTVDGLAQARNNGAYCIGICDTLVSPISRFAHEQFVTAVETPSYGASYVAPISLLNAIAVACGNYRRKRTLALLKKVEEEQRHGFRWYEA
jgi:DNA-binding MurR/RpiR family transcriptional regulator